MSGLSGTVVRHLRTLANCSLNCLITKETIYVIAKGGGATWSAWNLLVGLGWDYCQPRNHLGQDGTPDPPCVPFRQVNRQRRFQTAS
jgi:hypothetical protein